MMAMISAIRNPRLWVREGRVWESRSVAGNGLPDSGCSVFRLADSAGGLCVVVCSIPLLIAFQILPDPLFGIANGVGQLYFREIMSIKTLDVILMGRGHCFLRLHNFQIVCHAGSETILRLC